MADSKKYDGSQWEHSLRKLTTATEAVENPLYSDGTDITSYTIKGNTVQNGTPTPSNPVEVQGVGIKTANLLSGWTKGQRLDPSTGVARTDIAEACTTDYIAVDKTKTYIAKPLYLNYSSFVAAYNASKQFLGRTSATQRSSVTFDSTSFTSGTPQGTGDIAYIRITIYNAGSQTGDIDDAIAMETMMNEGNTVLPYEPYGYKIPISSGGVTTNIYLNEPLMGIATADEMASTGTVTRAYKKVVLNSNIVIGTYTTQWGIAFVIYTSNVSSGAGSALIDAVCSHYDRTTRDNIWRSSGSTLRAITLSGENNAFLISDPTYTTLQDFKDYIATQYNNGTPITVIVAVTTPTTETVTAPSIPTTDGANTITVDTTIQPSEFTATWTGWHDASVKEYDGANWQ